MCAQQNYENKLLKMELPYAGDFHFYLSAYLNGLKFVNDEKYDMLNHKNLNFLFS